MKDTTNETTSQYSQIIHLQQNTSSFDDVDNKTIVSTNTMSKLPIIADDIKRVSSNNYILRSKNHVKMAHFIVTHGPEFAIPQAEMSRMLNIEKQAVKRGLDRFCKDGFAEYEAACEKNGRRTTVIRVINPDIYHLNKKKPLFDHIVPLSLDRQIERNSFYLSEDQEKKQLIKFNENDFQAFWPTLYGKGFGPSQIKQIVTARLKAKKSIGRILTSLDYIEFELQKGICLDSKGNEFMRPGAFYNALLQHGEWRKPEGFKTGEDRRIEEEQEELARQAAKDKKATKEKMRIQKDKNEMEFCTWKNSLSAEKIAEYIEEWRQKNSHLPANEERILKLKWGKIGNDINSNS